MTTEPAADPLTCRRGARSANGEGSPRPQDLLARSAAIACRAHAVAGASAAGRRAAELGDLERAERQRHVERDRAFRRELDRGRHDRRRPARRPRSRPTPQPRRSSRPTTSTGSSATIKEVEHPHFGPVPNLRWLEADPSVLGVQFFVMDRVDGVVPTDLPPYAVAGWVAEGTPSNASG